MGGADLPPAALARPLAAGSRERALLLACARSTIDDATAARIHALLHPDLDWDHLLHAAEVHQVAPLLARHLAGRFARECPAPVVARLRGMLASTAARNLLLADALVQAVRLLDAHGIRVLAYKGPMLAVGVYGDPSLRWFGDVDVLVHGHDYRFTVPAVLAAHRWHAGADRGHERTWRKGAASLDVHVAVTPQRLMPFDLRFGDAWRRRATLALRTGDVPTFCAEDLLIVLCVQLAKDAAEERRAPILVKVCDIAELLRRLRPASARIVLRRARRLGVLRIVLVGAKVAQAMLGAPLPGALAVRLRRTRRVDALARHVEERVLGGRNAMPTRPEWLDVERWNAALRERARDRARWLRELRHYAIAPNERDHAYVRLPRALWPLYVALRPIRLAHQAAARLLRGAARPGA